MIQAYQCVRGRSLSCTSFEDRNLHFLYMVAGVDSFHEEILRRIEWTSWKAKGMYGTIVALGGGPQNKDRHEDEGQLPHFPFLPITMMKVIRER